MTRRCEESSSLVPALICTADPSRNRHRGLTDSRRTQLLGMAHIWPGQKPVFGLWQVLDSNKSGGFLARGDTAQTAAD